MGIFDSLKSLFGGHNQNESSNLTPPTTYFIKPDWANEDEEDTDDDLVMRNPRNHTNFTFSIFSNPLEIHRYFEQQMTEMAKQFEETFARDSLMYGNGLDSFFSKANQVPAIVPPSDDAQSHGTLRDKCFKPEVQRRREDTLDSDLDKEFKNGQLDLFKSPKVPPIEKPQVFSSQIFTRVVRRPDGSIEEIRTKQVGDQKYTKITRTDSAGQTNIHEDIVNIDENQLKDFQSVGESPLPRVNHFGDWFRFRL